MKQTEQDSFEKMVFRKTNSHLGRHVSVSPSNRHCGIFGGRRTSLSSTNRFLSDRHFLVYVNSRYLVGHCFLPTWNRRNARAKIYTPSRATTLPDGTDGATQIGSKRTFRTKLLHGLASSMVATIFAVPRPLIVHVPTRFDFHIDGWAAGPCETLA
jgi:hypothetical protein